MRVQHGACLSTEARCPGSRVLSVLKGRWSGGGGGEGLRGGGGGWWSGGGGGHRSRSRDKVLTVDCATCKGTATVSRPSPVQL